MYGSEFSWGIVLFSWLLGVAAGAALGGWGAGRLGRADLAIVANMLALGFLSCLEIWLFRGARGWLGIAPGELLPLIETAGISMFFVAPAGALVGLAFPLACSLIDQDGESTRGIGPLAGVYGLESAGSLVGGAAFSFWAVDRLSPIETALICLGIVAAASAGLLWASGRERVAGLVLFPAAAVILLTAFVGGGTLNRRLIDRRWNDIAPGYELCSEVESRYQNLALGRRETQFTLYCDGQVTSDFPDPLTFAPLAHFWMCQHPSPRRVLVLGGGAEGLLAEILKHPIESLDYVDHDPRLGELIEPFLADEDRHALESDRISIHHSDARYYVKTQRNRFDLVIANLPEPTSAQRARFYTDEFIGELRRAMTHRSVLCLSALAAPGELSAESAGYLASIRATLERHFPYITVSWGNPARVLAASEPDLISTDPAELSSRFSERGIESRFFQPLWFEGAMDWLDPLKLQERKEQLDAAEDVLISTDLHPAIYLQRLAIWEKMSRPPGSLIERLRSLDLPLFLLTLASITAAVVISRARRGPAGTGWIYGPLALSMGTTGFVTMALSILWLFAFQNLYGYVYQRIGWIIALFMCGLVIGCSIVSLWSRRASSSRGRSEFSQALWRRLVAVDLLLAVLSVAAPPALILMGSLQAARLDFLLVEGGVSLLVAVTGLLCGAAFALAGGLQFEVRGGAAAAAGSVVGADHTGACLGALVTGILLVPVYGVVTTAYLLAGIKLGSAVILFLGNRLSRGA